MGPDMVSDLMREVLREALLLSAPALLLVAGVSFLISVVQTLTSIQDQTIATVPRLLLTAVLLLVGAPWLMHHMVDYTVTLFTNFHRYIGVR